MEDEDTIAPVDATLPSGGFDATLAPGATLGTLAPGARVIVRGGGADYADLVPIDPAHYVIGDEIARGGMGRILAARDRRLGRRVAIKELLGASPDARARFEREARITARLQHPAIVNILEAGAWPNGEPFYVMRLVTGASLDAAIAARPTLATRLELLPSVIAVVDALAYAHSEQVIHRDLKPANVLVGAFGETVVIDWGLAKDLTDASGEPEPMAGPYRTAAGETEVGAVMGTPAYMPLEQALGESVDSRADVYALGALLYHLIAGRAPYVATTSSEVLASVIEGPPPPLGPETPAELVTIVTKAMAREAGDRYPTAQELAADLKKFATGNLVGAHPYSAWQLVRRWLRRHRTAVMVAAIATIALSVVGAVSFRGVVHARQRAEDQRARAEISRGDAEGVMGYMLTDLRDKLQPLGQLAVLKDVATKAVAYYDRKTTELSTVELEQRGQALVNLGDVLRELGESDGALHEYRAAIAIDEAMDPPTRGSLEHNRIGDVLLRQGDVTGALAEYRTGLANADAKARQAPANADLQSDVAFGHRKVGDVLRKQADNPGAVTEYRASLAITEALARREPANPERQKALAFSHGMFGDMLRATGDTAGALAEYRIVQAIFQALAAKDPTNADRQRWLSLSADKMGAALLQGEDVAGALAQYRMGEEIAVALAAKDPSNTEWQRDVLIGHKKLGRVLLAKGDHAAALVELHAAQDVGEALVAKDPKNAQWQFDLATTENAIGDALHARGDARDARAMYERALGSARRILAASPDDGDVRKLVDEIATKVAQP